MFMVIQNMQGYCTQFFLPVLVFWLLMLRKSQVAIMIFLLLMPTLSDLNLKQTHYNFSLKMA
ncbi:hypothetical protein A6S26_21095 [Nostoc sp. ATCC 43529]|nr:hypothetical protein A6S26_21095 [Nostoc sp. ATCC 43529]